MMLTLLVIGLIVSQIISIAGSGLSAEWVGGEVSGGGATLLNGFSESVESAVNFFFLTQFFYLIVKRFIGK